MKRKKIVIDMDGVLADFCAGFTGLGKMLGLIVNPICNATQLSYGFEDIPREHKAIIWDSIVQSSVFWRDLPALLTSSEVLTLQEMERQHDLYFLTARLGNDPKHQTEMWLADHGVYCPTVVIIASYRPDPNKHAPLLKRAFCQAIGADYFIDDKPSIVKEVAQEKKTVSVLREWLYSKDFEHEPRVKSFMEFVEMVNK